MAYNGDIIGGGFGSGICVSAAEGKAEEVRGGIFISEW